MHGAATGGETKVVLCHLEAHTFNCWVLLVRMV